MVVDSLSKPTVSVWFSKEQFTEFLDSKWCYGSTKARVTSAVNVSVSLSEVFSWEYKEEGFYEVEIMGRDSL